MVGTLIETLFKLTATCQKNAELVEKLFLTCFENSKRTKNYL